MLPRLHRAFKRRHTALAMAVLLLGSGTAYSQQQTLRERLYAIEEVTRISPPRALRQLEQVRPEVEKGAPSDRAAFLSALSDAHHLSGKNEEALKLAEHALAIGRNTGDRDVVARAYMSKAFALSHLDKVGEAHSFAWEAEKLARTTTDMRLRVHSLVVAGDAHVEDGSFAPALDILQTAAAVARKHGDPLLEVVSLRSLARLYYRMREYDKGFAMLDEAILAAKKANSPSRLALLKSTEYVLAIDSNQFPRALSAMLTALELQRSLDAAPLIGSSLVNLSDCYLKMGNHAKALDYAQQALAHAETLGHPLLAATARLNLGQAYLQLGQRALGKQQMKMGMDWFEKSGNKPNLQRMTGEYADALAHAGDHAGAVLAYQRERTLLNELFEERRQKSISEMQERYEAEKKQRQIEWLRQENQVKSVEIDNRRLQQRIWWLMAVIMALVATIVAFLYRKVRHANTQLESKNLQLKQLSACDPLTGLYNRRHFQDFMRAHDAQAAQGDKQDDDLVGAIYLLDVDHFKSINDTHGHAVGDAVLVAVANAIRNIMRETDMIVRWGGEEFLIFLPMVRRSNLDEVAQRLLAGIPTKYVEHQGLKLSVEVSIGFAPYPLAPSMLGASWERVVNLVDMALYLAKGHGRNRAYGIQGLEEASEATLDAIEDDIESAWRSGRVNLSVIQGNRTSPDSLAA